jgi:hypothetical protein
MNTLLMFCAFFLLLLGTTYAQNSDILDKYHWSKRVLLVYTADNESPAYEQQIQEVEYQQAGVEDRDLVIFTVLPQRVINLEGKTLPPQSAEHLRQQYDVPSEQFAVILIGKDGGVKLKEKKFLSTDKLFSTIDQMPMRQREMRAN